MSTCTSVHLRTLCRPQSHTYITYLYTYKRTHCVSVLWPTRILERVQVVPRCRNTCVYTSECTYTHGGQCVRNEHVHGNVYGIRRQGAFTYTPSCKTQKDDVRTLKRNPRRGQGQRPLTRARSRGLRNCKHSTHVYVLTRAAPTGHTAARHERDHCEADPRRLRKGPSREHRKTQSLKTCTCLACLPSC